MKHVCDWEDGRAICTSALQKVGGAVVGDEVAGEQVADIEVRLPIRGLCQNPGVQHLPIHAAHLLHSQMSCSSLYKRHCIRVNT